MGEKPPRGRLRLGRRSRTVALVFFIFFLLSAGLYVAVRLNFLFAQHDQAPLLEAIFLGGVVLGSIVLLTSLLEGFVIGRLRNNASQFNLRRVLRLCAILSFGLAVLFLISSNWYVGLVSLGIMSLILGFALQTPITSFVGWIYILVQAPYRVGDRIKIGDATGDVIDVGYFDTTLWEFGGQYLSTDHPSGRIITFPNSNVLTAAVYNYSWPLFPYIWNEIKFNIAYGSDLEFVAKTMESATTEELGEEMIDRVRRYRDILIKTPVDEIQVQEKPVVLFRVNDNTWLEAIVRYLVDPKEAGRVKTELIRKILPLLLAEPGRVMFPRGDNR